MRHRIRLFCGASGHMRHRIRLFCGALDHVRHKITILWRISLRAPQNRVSPMTCFLVVFSALTDSKAFGRRIFYSNI